MRTSHQIMVVVGALFVAGILVLFGVAFSFREDDERPQESRVDILISPNGGEIYTVNDSLEIIWTRGELVESIYLIPLEPGCEIKDVGRVSRMLDLKSSDLSGCRRIALYSDVVYVDPVNSSGSFVYEELDEISYLLEGDEYHIMLLTPSGSFDMSDGPITIQE